MLELRKHFRKLMENVDINYQPPVNPNSGTGLTKFAPTPASKVLKNYTVDHDFIHKALSYGNSDLQAVDQIMGALNMHPANGVLDGNHFDNIVGSFSTQNSNAVSDSDALNLANNGGDPAEVSTAIPEPVNISNDQDGLEVPLNQNNFKNDFTDEENSLGDTSTNIV